MGAFRKSLSTIVHKTCLGNSGNNVECIDINNITRMSTHILSNVSFYLLVVCIRFHLCTPNGRS